MKAVVAAFNQEKALVGAFSVITNLRMDLFIALLQARRVLPPPDRHHLAAAPPHEGDRHLLPLLHPLLLHVTVRLHHRPLRRLLRLWIQASI